LTFSADLCILQSSAQSRRATRGNDDESRNN
jgi:hypothetical protein